MPTNHFVAVGGTGQHAALALTDIAVLGEWLNPLADTRVWLFDADASGTPGNETAWDLVLQQSKFLLRERAAANTGWRNPSDGHHKPFDTTFEVTRFGDLLHDEHRNLVFSAQQQGVNFRDGYFGQPAVAATLFAHLLDRPHTAFSDLLAAPREAQSRIVLAGSAVGGTGSGCLPSLAQRLSDPARNNGAEAGDRLLSVLFLPWFRLEGAGPDAERRNQEMTARTASGLLYYQNSLAKRSPTVLIGQPDASLTRKTRPWSGDTQQPLHEDLTLPFYAGAVAAQFINGLKLPKGLYAVARPAENVVLHDRVPYDDNDNALSSLRALARANRVLLSRLHWVIRYVEARHDGFPAVFPFVLGFDVPTLPADAWSWLPRLREWLSFKERSLLRLERTLQPGVAIRRIADEPLVGGIPTLRSWFPEHQAPPQHADAFCQMLADGVLNDRAGDQDETPVESAERLLPERIAEATTTANASQAAAPLRARVGTPTPLDSADVQARIHLDRVEPEALPAGNSRAFLLRHRLSQHRTRPAPLRQMLSANRLEDRPIDRLVQQWGLLLLLAAHGRIRIGGALEHAAHGPWLNLLDHLREPECDAPRPIIWNDERKEVVVGYTDPKVLFVPAPLTLPDWDRMLRALPVDRDPLLRSVGSWARFLNQLGRAAKRKELDWLVALDQGLLDPKEAEPLLPFGMKSGSDIEVRWDQTDDGGTRPASVFIKLPNASGRADDSWHSLFDRVGVRVTTQKPPDDSTADHISEMLNSLPTFQWFPVDAAAAPLRRRVLWVSNGAPALNLVVSQHLQERYYISTSTGCVWDVEAEAADGGPVMALRPQDVLLSEIGALDTFAIRFPDLPIRREYADLLDFGGPPSKPKVADDKRTLTYTLVLRGLDRAVQHTATLDAGLKLSGGCLLWPKFATPSWRERYVLLTAPKAACTILCGTAREGQLSHQQPVKVDPKVPVGFRLPADAVYPRALAIHKQDGKDAGLYYLETTHITPSGVERWGVDFGTQASVIAIANNETGDSGTRLLEPLGASDATLVVHSPGELPRKVITWFSTWDGEGPRRDAPRLMPSAFVWRRDLPTDSGQRLNDESTYCREWMLDHGSPLENERGLYVQSRFKWKAENSPSRRAYLLRLLEQAVAWRAGFVLPGQASPLPQSVTLVFTLPLSMRDEVVAFERDTLDVATRLKELTGVHFDVKYQWESIAASMPLRARSEDRVYAALDLGGGSFDLWGSFHHLGERGRTSLEDPEAWQSRAESYMLGGTALFDALVRGGLNAKELDTGLRNLDQDEAAYAVVRGAEGYQTEANFFFDAVTEASARWIAALLTEARELGIAATTVDVSLLGRAWYLGDKAWQQPASALKRIALRMAALGVEARLEPFRDLPTSARERKSYLARAVAANSDSASKSLLGGLDTHPGYVSTELIHESTKVVVPWTTRLPLSGLDPALRVKLHDSKGTILHPSVPPALTLALSRSQTEVDKSLNQTVLSGGFRSGDMKDMERSPFVRLMDRAIKAWQGE